MSTAINPSVTLRDVAAVAGVSYETAARAMGAKASRSSATLQRVRNIADRLGYDRTAARAAAGKRGGSAPKTAPANSLFASRDAETEAMLKLRAEGHNNAEIARRCGVTRQTVHKRIGVQPDELTKASMKLAGATRKAKSKIKESYAQQQAVTQYNELAAQINAQLETAQKMASQLSSMQKSAAKASKATKKPLLRLLTFPSVIAQ